MTATRASRHTDGRGPRTRKSGTHGQPYGVPIYLSTYRQAGRSGRQSPRGMLMGRLVGVLTGRLVGVMMGRLVGVTIGM